MDNCQANKQSVRYTILKLCRYKTLYKVDVEDLTNYDCVLDTTNSTPEEIFQIVFKAYQTWLQK
ncbi:MAG: hypothetical protein PHV76_05245 [Bacteroidales bacterium]|nr:hypothetical protein [Bacteroidales bacterium]MDD4704158.1 hypothetical protein [Bacteroidales bacterium]